MSDNTSKLTDEEMEDVQAFMEKMLEKISNKYDIDRDSLLGYFTIALSVFCEMVTAKKIEDNSSCKCNHNSNTNEHCDRCDSKAAKGLEIQTCKKPIDRCMFKECPTCGEVEIQGCNFCPSCGQKLDWGGDKYGRKG